MLAILLCQPRRKSTASSWTNQATAAAKKAEKAEKEAEENKVETKPVVPMESAECQTDIGMDYFDRPASLRQDSRASGTESQKKRVGGGGSIVKPPRHSSK